MLWSSWLAVSIILATFVHHCDLQGLAPETCPNHQSYTLVEPDADVIIGALLQVHEPGAGVYGCGPPTPEGVEVFESMRWAVSVLNQNSGLLNGGTVSQSFIPGVKIGLKVYDSCGHREAAVQQMTELFPVLTSGPASCGSESTNSSAIIGVLDMAKTASNPRVAEATYEYVVPIIPLSMATSVLPEHLAKVITEVTVDMDWERVAVIHSDDEYSVHVTKQLSQMSMTGGKPCFIAVHSIPDAEGKGRTPDLRSYRKVIASVTSRLKDNTGILIVAQGETVHLLLQVMAEMVQTVSRFQWLFSWIPPPTLLTGFGDALNSKRILSLGPFPSKIAQLEDHWTRLQDLGSPTTSEDNWFLEYIMFRKNCRVQGISSNNNRPLCSNLNLHDAPADVLLRTSRALPALHGVFTFAHALRKAWEDRCLQKPGMCSALRLMNRREFVGQYLEPLEFQHGPEQRSPPEVTGKKSARSSTGEIESMKVALITYSYDQSQGVDFKPVVAYESAVAEVLDYDFRYRPSSCGLAGCKDCIRVRQSRLENQETSRSNGGLVIIGKSEDVLIPLLLPLHFKSDSVLDCGTTINPLAVQNLEAFLWALDKVNSDDNLLPGIKLGTVIIDTCFSTLKTTQRVSSYLEESSDGSKVDLLSSLAVVTSSSPEESTVASSLFSALNITVVATEDMNPQVPKKKIADTFNLQMEIPMSVKAEAMVEVLKYQGWMYVSVVYKDEPGIGYSYKSFRKLAKDAGVCFSVEQQVTDLKDESFDRIVSNLIISRDRGARVVILWTSESASNGILKGIRRAANSSFVHQGDFILLTTSSWADNPLVIENFESEAAGSLVFDSYYSDVRDFVTHFRRLTPEGNKRNPWFEELWRQRQQCPNCTNTQSGDGLLTYLHHPSTTNIIQAVLAIASGVGRLRSEICEVDKGFCPQLLQHEHLRSLVYQYILHTTTSRVDQKDEKFGFVSEGYRSTPVDIFNFRRAAGNVFGYQKVGSYKDRLTNLVSMVTYNSEGEEIGLETLPSECIKDCMQCNRRSMDFMVLDSEDNLYLAATLGVHDRTSNPLECGRLSSSSGLQSLEAFLWALDQVNNSPQLLPGVNIGALVFDTCNSRERAARDVSNFISGSLAPVGEEKLPGVANLLGIVANQRGDVVQSVVDVATPLKITTIASTSSSTVLDDVHKYPYLLRLALPNTLLADSLVGILKHFHWTYVSVVYSDDPWEQGDIYHAFQELSQLRGLNMAMVQKVIDMEEPDRIMDEIVRKLKMHQMEGARVVVVLLNSNQTSHLLSAVKRAQEDGQVGLGDFLWVSVDNVEAFHHHPEQSLGALIVRPSSGQVLPFKHYFETLSLRNNTRNPWFREYWEEMFKCRGATCYSELHENLRQVTFMQDPQVPHIVNSVLSIAAGLDGVRKALCPGYVQGLCPEMTDNHNFRNLLFNYTKSASFMGADGRNVKFTKDHYSASRLEVFNFRQVGSNAHAFVGVGNYNEENGLSMNNSRVKAYDPAGFEISLYDITSTCNNSDVCASGSTYRPTHVLQAEPVSEFTIAAVMPVHTTGKQFFKCGDLGDDTTFQNLAAFVFAVNQINLNDSFLPGIRLGTLVFDYCGQIQRAEEMLYNYFAQSRNAAINDVKVKSKSVIATLTFGEEVAKEIEPILEAAGVSQVASPAASSMAQVPMDMSDMMRTAPASDDQFQVLAQLMDHFKWKYIHLIYTDNDYGREAHWEFSKIAKNNDICISETLKVQEDASPTDIASTMQELFVDPQVRVVILLMDNPSVVKNTLIAAKYNYLLEQFVWLGTDGWSDDPKVAQILDGTTVDAFTVKMESQDIPEFKEFLSRLTLDRHDPFPDTWFEEFWQRRFHCQLPNSIVAQFQYPDICNGQEHMDSKTLVQDKHVYHTVQAVNAIASGFHNYLSTRCTYGMAAMDIDHCGSDARDQLLRFMKTALMGEAALCEECGPLRSMFGYQIYQAKNDSNGVYSYQQVGSWNGYNIHIQDDDITFMSGSSPMSTCSGECEKCLVRHERHEQLVPRQAVYANFKTVWGIIVTALSILGMVLVLICALYFLMAFPVTVGTTVLGYMILFGLLVLYAVNFAFIVAPTEGTCGLRRFVLGLAYAIVFSGMLVKMMNTWRLMGYHGSRMMADGTKLSTPAGLLVIAVGLVIIQVILSSAWLILMPPKTGVYEKVWRCAPPTTFEEGLVISLVYVMLLLAITTLFGLLTWKCEDNNKESRWILACCVLVGLVWLAWTVLSTQLPPMYRDITIVGANLTSATIVMLCLYLRKVYLYSKLTRQARDREMKARLHPMKYPHNLYGTVNRPGGLAAVSPVLYGSQASLNGKKIFGNGGGGGGPPSRLELINCPTDDARSDSSGSVQVQAADLYPLDMYDGGSQFQPMTSLYGSNHTLILDDSLTFTR